MSRLRKVIALASLGCLFGCEEPSTTIGNTVQLLADSRGRLSEEATDQLLPRGRAALPYLEAALHTANPIGRRNLVIALRRLEFAEAAPLLGQIAAYDSDLATAREATLALRYWQSQSRNRVRSAAASLALHKVDEVRGNQALLLDP